MSFEKPEEEPKEKPAQEEAGQEGDKDFQLRVQKTKEGLTPEEKSNAEHVLKWLHDDPRHPDILDNPDLPKKEKEKTKLPESEEKRIGPREIAGRYFRKWAAAFGLIGALSSQEGVRAEQSDASVPPAFSITNKTEAPKAPNIYQDNQKNWGPGTNKIDAASVPGAMREERQFGPKPPQYARPVVRGQEEVSTSEVNVPPSNPMRGNMVAGNMHARSIGSGGGNGYYGESYLGPNNDGWIMTEGNPPHRNYEGKTKIFTNPIGRFGKKGHK